MTVCVHGIEVYITKKKIKNIHLSVNHLDGKVKLSVPKSLSEKAIRDFLCSKTPWIKKQINKVKNQIKLINREYITGENIYVFGKLYNLTVLEVDTKSSLAIFEDEIIYSCKKDTFITERKKYFDWWYRQLLIQKVPSLLGKWQVISGLNCGAWQIRDMKTRWGTYSPKTQKIWLNLQLAKKPIECIEYVILHELAHILVPNHGKSFVAILDKYMPNWRVLKKQLNNQTIYYLE